MIHDVLSAHYLGDYKIELVFDDGKSGVVDFSRYREKGGVFDKFRDITFFRKFKIDEELGTIAWPDGIDIAPETLYAKATDTPLPSWVEVGDEPKRSIPASG